MADALSTNRPDPSQGHDVVDASPKGREHGSWGYTDARDFVIERDGERFVIPAWIVELIRNAPEPT